MFRSTKLFAILGLMAALVSAQGDAPPAPGDWIIGDINAAVGSGGAYAITPATGAVNTVAVGRPAGFFNWVVMAGNNRDLAAAYSTAGRFALVTPAGVITSGFVYPSSQNGIDYDQNGTYLASTSGTSQIFRISNDGLTGSVLFAVPATANNVCIDHDTGDYVAAVFSGTVGVNGLLLRANRTTLAITTIAAFPNPAALTGRLSSVDHCQQDGNFYVTRFDAGEVLQVTPGGVVTTVHNAATAPGAIGFWGANGVKCDDETGNLLVAGLANNAALPARVGVMTRTGTIVTQYIIANPAGFNPTSAEIYGSRKVSGLGNFAAGSVYTVNFSFPASSGFSYVAAMSLGLRPAVITLPDGRSVNLAFDPLLILSLGGIPGITTGFSGILDANGNATGTVTLPPGFPAGVRVYISAVAVNPSFPSGLDTANSLGATSN
jgi:hypothetical protein